MFGVYYCATEVTQYKKTTGQYVANQNTIMLQIVTGFRHLLESVTNRFPALLGSVVCSSCLVEFH